MVVGRVVQGMHILEAIGSLKVDGPDFLAPVGTSRSTFGVRAANNYHAKGNVRPAQRRCRCVPRVSFAIRCRAHPCITRSVLVVGRGGRCGSLCASGGDGGGAQNLTFINEAVILHSNVHKCKSKRELEMGAERRGRRRRRRA